MSDRELGDWMKRWRKWVKRTGTTGKARCCLSSSLYNEEAVDRNRRSESVVGRNKSSESEAVVGRNKSSESESVVDQNNSSESESVVDRTKSSESESVIDRNESSESVVDGIRVKSEF